MRPSQLRHAPPLRAMLAGALLVAAAASGAQAPVPADPELTPDPAPVYDIELIVFAYRDGLRGRSEDFAWQDDGRERAREAREALLADPPEQPDGAPGTPPEPDDGIAPDASDDADPDDAASTDAGDDADDAEATEKRQLEFWPLVPDEMRLQEVIRRMDLNGGFVTLVHTAWRQPVYGPEEETTLDLERVASLPPEFAGSASIYVTRFLHLELDLALADRRAPAALADTLIYRLSERRKMRSTELHFFDHPRFGALALISPVDSDDDSADVSADAPADAPEG